MSKAAPRKLKAEATNKDGDEIKEAFNLLDINGNGVIDPKELKFALRSLDLEETNPIITSLVTFFNTPQYKNKEIDYETFEQAYKDLHQDKTSKAGLLRIFKLYVDPESNVITLDGLTKIAKELGENVTKEELREIFEKASSNKVEITFDDFYALMAM